VAASTTAPTQHERRELYIEVAALETLLTSDYALGEVFETLLSSVGLDAGLDLHPNGQGPNLRRLFTEFVADDDTPADLLVHARHELLVARLLRAITPEQLTAAAAHFERIAAEKLQRAHAAIDAKRWAEGLDDILKGRDADA
jgi:hypothetical protein